MAWSLPEAAVLAIIGDKDVPPNSPIAAEIGYERAGEMHRAMLFDLLDLWSNPNTIEPGGRRVLLYGPEDAGEWFDPRVPSEFAMQPKSPRCLGHVIEDFLEGEFNEGIERVVVLRGDCPTLDPAIVVSAFLCLQGRDFVIGPSTDGGFYLFGARKPVGDLLEGIRETDPRHLNVLTDRIADSGKTLALLPPWYAARDLSSATLALEHIRAMRVSGTLTGLLRLESLSR